MAYALAITFGWAHSTVNGLRTVIATRPRPQIRFVRSNPSESPISQQKTLATVRPDGAITAIERTLKLHSLGRFARAEFANIGGDIPTQALERPLLRAIFSDGDGTVRATVNEVRIAGTTERLDASNPDQTPRTPRDVRASEIRAGEHFIVDLLMRRKGDSIAHTWSNDDPVLGVEDFPPGTYRVVIEFHGDNLPEGQYATLEIQIPDDPEDEIMVTSPE